MDLTEFGQLMLEEMPFEPTGQQIKLTAALARFCSAETPSDSVFILNGYAGTGKTSVIGALVRTLHHVNTRTILMASTGRAAKVMSNLTKYPAHTIHRQIYSSASFNNDGAPTLGKLNENPHINTVFIVDEASMIGEGNDGGINLLHDLVMYVYSGQNCKLILIGDTAQLPPVGSTESPAMTAKAFKELGLRVTRATITATVRQKRRSGILYNATRLRHELQLLDENPEAVLPEPQLTVSKFQDICLATPEEMEDEIGKSYSTYGEDSTILITRSNRRALDFNLAIRRQIFDREEILVKGDRLLISKNNYYWPNRHRQQLKEEAAKNNRPGIQMGVEMWMLEQPQVLSRHDLTPQAPAIRSGAATIPVPGFLANGEIAIVEDVTSTETRDMMLFADVMLYLPDSGARLSAKVNLSSLTTEGAGIPREQLEALGRHTLLDAGYYYGPPLAQRDTLRACPYFNALQVKYAYAVTCHKAQGGQWDSVFIDMGYIPPEAYHSKDFYRWLYTSVTRATRRLTLLSPACRIL